MRYVHGLSGASVEKLIQNAECRRRIDSKGRKAKQTNVSFVISRRFEENVRELFVSDQPKGSQRMSNACLKACELEEYLPAPRGAKKKRQTSSKEPKRNSTKAYVVTSQASGGVASPPHLR